MIRRGLADRLGISRGATAAIATIVAVGIATSLVTPLVSLTLASRGVSERTIGAVIATYAIAMLIASPHTAWIAIRLGAANAMVAITCFGALLIPLVWLIEGVGWMFPIMFLYGGCIALCFTLSEFWIAANTPEGSRGFVIGIYATLLALGFAVGPAVIALLGSSTIHPFVIGSTLMVLAALPAFLARHASPEVHEQPTVRFSTFILAVPVATIGALTFAVGETGGFAFLPLWGDHLGFSPTLAALLISAMTLGNVAFQIPLGMLSDRMDRRLILLGCALLGALGMLIAWSISASPLALVVVLFLWGGATAGIYTVGLAHLAARFSGSDLAGANAAFVFCYALGMLAGPLAIGDAMARAPLSGFPLIMGLAFTGYAVVVAIQIVRRRS
jgi:MFS family permease